MKLISRDELLRTSSDGNEEFQAHHDPLGPRHYRAQAHPSLAPLREH